MSIWGDRAAHPARDPAGGVRLGRAGGGVAGAVSKSLLPWRRQTGSFAGVGGFGGAPGAGRPPAGLVRKVELVRLYHAWKKLPALGRLGALTIALDARGLEVSETRLYPGVIARSRWGERGEDTIDIRRVAARFVLRRRRRRRADLGGGRAACAGAAGGARRDQRVDADPRGFAGIGRGLRPGAAGPERVSRAGAERRRMAGAGDGWSGRPAAIDGADVFWGVEMMSDTRSGLAGRRRGNQIWSVSKCFTFLGRRGIRFCR